MKKLLIITYWFPPRPSVGSVRLGGLVKYLPEFDWEPVVLTSTLPGKPISDCRVVETDYIDRMTRFNQIINQFTQSKKPINSKQQTETTIINSGVAINKNEKRRPFFNKLINFGGEIISYPDGQKGWKKIAVNDASILLNQERYNAILSSSGPVTVHLIAHDLKKKHQVPWMADLRDLWTDHFTYPYSNMRKYFERKLEAKTFSLADCLSTVSDPWNNKLSELHKNKLIHTIHNGFDPETFAQPLLTKEFTITYTGTIYDGKHDPSLLFSAVRELISEKRIDPQKINVRFYGRRQNWIDLLIQKNNLTDIVKQYGLLHRDKALQKQRESQVLLFLDWGDLQERGWYSAKIYEYLAAKRPILAPCFSESVVTQLLQETNAGKYAFTLDKLKASIMKYYDEFTHKGEVTYKGKYEIIQNYSHREMAKKFSIALNQISQETIRA